MDVSQLDLNLMVVLDVLLQERSVTRAARRLGRSQPAVSHALSRLREAVDDPLFVRRGRALVPTPRAEQLGAAARVALAGLERALQGGPDFDPATSRRTLRIASSDLLAPAVPDLLQALSEAPGVALQMLPRVGVEGVDRADLVLDMVPQHASGVVARKVGVLQSAVVCRRGHPALEAPWDVDAWCRWPHVLVRTSDGASSLVERALATVGRSRHVGLTVSELLLVPHVVSRTDLLFTGPRQILALLAEPLGLTSLPVPLPMPEVGVALMWHERHQHEPGHTWLRQRIGDAVEAVLSAGAPPRAAPAGALPDPRR